MAASGGGAGAAVKRLVLFERFLAQPARFRFDAAIRLLMHARRTGSPAKAALFRTPANLSYPPADIVSVAPDAKDDVAEIGIGIGGLTGPSGILPRYYTEHVMQQVRGGARGMHAFLDMLAHRMVSALAQAGIKYRPYRTAEQDALGGPADLHRTALVALVGKAEQAQVPQDDLQDFILYHSGVFAAWPRSAERLEAILSDWAGQRVGVEAFVGDWLDIPEAERTRLPKARGAGQFNRLGVDAAIGVRAWDAQSKIILRVAPMPYATFQAFMPLQSLARQLVELARAYLGPSAAFALNPVVVRTEVPKLQLGPEGRLGWNIWLPKDNRGDAADAVFPAHLVERLARRNRAA